MMKRKYLKQKHGWVEERELLRATKKPYKKPGAWWQKIASNSNMAASISAGLGGQVQCYLSPVDPSWDHVLSVGSWAISKNSCPIWLKAQSTSNNS